MSVATQRTSGRKVGYSILVAAAALVVVFVVAEGIARWVAPEIEKTGSYRNVSHAVLGWTPKPNSSGTERSSEFLARYAINSIGLNDDPMDPFANAETRIAALGDSHTFALGVDTHQAWPNVLERMLFAEDRDRGTVFNLGVIGYSLGQYVQRLKLLKDTLRIDTVIVGFSMATDLYDLIPPRKGGFVYEPGVHRIYYDLSQDGTLQERDSAKDVAVDNTRKLNKSDYSLKIRGVLQHLALYRALRRSSLATWIAVDFRPGGSSLWPGLETALRSDLSAEQAYRWRLAEAILADLASYADDHELRLVVVNIPYLAQVYDEIWESSFGRRPESYDRWIGGERLARICQKLGIDYIDTTQELVRESRKNQIWLHYRQDGHPTPRGHESIARSIYRGLAQSGLSVRDPGDGVANR